MIERSEKRDTEENRGYKLNLRPVHLKDFQFSSIIIFIAFSDFSPL